MRLIFGWPIAQRSYLKMKITKIISGAQTGADRAGIDAAIACGVPYGGKIPAGRRAEDGPISIEYKNLEEIPQRNYLVRTEANVVESDATIIFTKGAPTGGSELTARLCINHSKKWLLVDCRENDFQILSEDILEWLSEFDNDIVLNVAGSRESKCKGIYKTVYHSMINVLI